MAIVDLEFKAWVAQMESEFPQMFHDETASRVAMDFRLDIARMAFTAGRAAQRKALSHAAGQEVEPEEYWVGIVRRYRSPLQRFIRMHAQFDYDRDRNKNAPRSAEDWAAVMVDGALSGHPHPAVARSEGED